MCKYWEKNLYLREKETFHNRDGVVHAIYIKKLATGIETVPNYYAPHAGNKDKEPGDARGQGISEEGNRGIGDSEMNTEAPFLW